MWCCHHIYTKEMPAYMCGVFLIHTSTVSYFRSTCGKYYPPVRRVTGGRPKVPNAMFRIPYTPKIIVSPTNPHKIARCASARFVSSPAFFIKMRTPHRNTANAPAAMSIINGFIICIMMLFNK